MTAAESKIRTTDVPLNSHERFSDDDLKEAAKRIASLGFPALEHVLTHEDPVEDKKLARVLGDVQLDKAHHRPSRDPDEFHSGETTSWVFGMRQYLKEKWHTLRIKILDAIATANSEEVLKVKLSEIQRGVEQEFGEKVEQWLPLLKAYLPPEMAEKDDVALREHIYLLSSGGNAIAWMASALHLKYGGRVIYNLENGSDVYGTVALTVGEANVGKPIPFRSETNGEPNVPLAPEVAIQAWKTQIDNGGRVLIITLGSKTGFCIDKQSFATGKEVTSDDEQTVLDVLLEMCAQHNQQNPDEQVAVIFDVVQKMGRVALGDALAPLYTARYARYSELIKAVVFTNSKANQAASHAGVVITTPSGQDDMEMSMTSDDQEQREQVMRHAGSAKMAYSPLLERYGFDEPAPPYLTMLRAMDGFDAMEVFGQHEQELNTDRYREIIQAYRDFYTLFGFRLLESHLPSIIPMQDPFALNELQLHNDFLKELAIRERSMGGTLLEKSYTSQPILRFGVSNTFLYNQARTVADVEKDLYGEIGKDEVKSILSRTDGTPNGLIEAYQTLSESHAGMASDLSAALVKGIFA